MRLRRFEVSGYKNLLEPVVLDELGPISVIHGDNNVGKSNLLEALELFFVCLNRRRLDNPTAVAVATSPADLFMGVGLDVASIFNILSPVPIRMKAEVHIEPRDFLDAGIDTMSDTLVVRVELQLIWDSSNPGMLRLDVQMGHVLPNGPVTNPRELSRVIATGVGYARRFQHVGVHREVWSGIYQGGMTPSVPLGRALISPALSLALYDLYNAEEPRQVARWEMFVEAMKDFQDLVEGGTPVPVYRRAENRAVMTIQMPQGGRIAADLLGSGIQQVIGLLGRMVVGGADVLAIEEPEMNLRHDLQERLRKSLIRMSEDPRVGMQLFLTSHSPAFEVGEHFFAMRKGARGPTVERRPVRDAAAFTGSASLPTRLPPSWLSSDGVVQLPADVRAHLGLERGGPVMFVETSEPEVLLMSNAAFSRSLGGE
jgi:AAA domain, putative AbiEii toxin, Type IV TA system